MIESASDNLAQRFTVSFANALTNLRDKPKRIVVIDETDTIPYDLRVALIIARERRASSVMADLARIIDGM